MEKTLDSYKKWSPVQIQLWQLCDDRVLWQGTESSLRNPSGKTYK